MRALQVFCVSLAPSITQRASMMKTYRVEVQRIKGMSNAHGMLHIQMDAGVLPGSAREDSEPTSWLSLSEESARTLQLLLKAQFAQIDGRKARSQR
jgi:hypothetical protein